MSDLRSETLKLAANLPAGDPTRRKILAALSRQAGATFRDEYGVFLSGYATQVRDSLNSVVANQGIQTILRGTNQLAWIRQDAIYEMVLTVSPSGPRKTVIQYSFDKWRTKLESRDVTNMDAMAMAKWLWKNTPAYMKS